MRVGKKPNVVEAKKTRSCVVRLEKVSKNSTLTQENRIATRTNRLGVSAMAVTPKVTRRGVAGTSQQEIKTSAGAVKKKIVASSSSNNTNFQTPQQQKSASGNNTANIRSNQKVKIIPRSNKTTPVSIPTREETPPPTIAAGRSRRAIKPNPKYASEDLCTSKVVRSCTTSRGAVAGQGGVRTRKQSTSSDDFYNRHSEDEYENEMNNLANDDDDQEEDLHNDKAYQASDKDEQDSDFSVIEDQPVRAARSRGSKGRSKRVQESSAAIIQKTTNKVPITQTPTIKRTSTTTALNSSNLRSAPSQLQQIRRSLASANAQRNISLLAGSGTAQKRKLEEIQDLSDNESGYLLKRRQLLISNSKGVKVQVPARDNRVNATSTPLTAKTRTQASAHNNNQQQTVNGSNKINYSQTTTAARRAIETSAKSQTDSVSKSSIKQTLASAEINQNNKTQNPLTTQAKMLVTKTNRFRSGSPASKLPTQKDKQNNSAAISISSSSNTSSSSSLNTNIKTNDKAKALSSLAAMKAKPSTASNNLGAISTDNAFEIKDDSPNSTMDDFETMPTFTIVNVNDIINKKGDVLITKSKSNSNKTPTVIEFSESISLDDDDDEDNDVEEIEASNTSNSQSKQLLTRPKLSTLNNRKEVDNKISPPTRSNESLRKLPIHKATSSGCFSNQTAPQILNHKLGLRSSRVTAKTTTTLMATLTSPDKPAPRILNSMVAKKTQPVKPMIANLDDSADESFPLSLDEDEEDDDEEFHEEQEEETEDEMESRNPILLKKITDKTRKREQHNLLDCDAEDTESQNTEDDETVLHTNHNTVTYVSPASNVAALTPKQQNLAPQRRTRMSGSLNTPIVVSTNKKRLKPAAAKENSLAATNQQVNDTTTQPTKQTHSLTLPTRKSNTEKVVISKQGDKIIKKITCFETWYVINMPSEQKRPTVIKNLLELPLIRLANNAKNISLPNDLWSSKVTLYELSPQTLSKGTFAIYTGDLYENNISEEERHKFQPSCVMFRRSIEKNKVSRMPYDRAVIFKNKTFYTNIEGKNVRLEGAPSIINCESEIEILLEVVDNLTLKSDFVEHISIVQ